MNLLFVPNTVIPKYNIILWNAKCAEHVRPALLDKKFHDCGLHHTCSILVHTRYWNFEFKSPPHILVLFVAPNSITLPPLLFLYDLALHRNIEVQQLNSDYKANSMHPFLFQRVVKS